MSPDDIRARQAPLKHVYKEHPERAVIHLCAEGRLGADVTCALEIRNGLVEAGLHAAAGGDGTKACPAEMLLEALAACAGVTMNAVATALGIELRRAVVRAEGDLDMRGTLGVAKDAPVGFRAIRLAFDLDTPAAAEDVEKLLRLTERYCVVYQTLRIAPEISAQARRSSSSGGTR